MTKRKNFYVARQPIVDRRGAISGHEFLFRDGGQDVTCPVALDGLAQTSAVVQSVMGAMGIDSTVGTRDAFLNCTDAFLFSDLVEMLPAGRFVLEVLEDVQLGRALADRCDSLRRAGFRIALDDVRSVTPDLVAFLPHVDIVKLDWPYIPPHAVEEMVLALKRCGKLVLAEKIEERADYEMASKAGCDLFQGYFFARPQMLVSKKVAPAVAAVHGVLQLLMDEANAGELVEALKRAPALVVQLLRLANSGSQSNSQVVPITSISQALSIAGTRQVMRWCCLLLYGTPSSLTPDDDPLIELVRSRAELMERAAMEIAPRDPSFAQQAYLLGLLSLAHIPHGVDVETFVEDLPVCDAIRGAMVDRSGVLGRLLSAAELIEAGTCDQLDTLPGSIDEACFRAATRHRLGL